MVRHSLRPHRESTCSPIWAIGESIGSSCDCNPATIVVARLNQQSASSNEAPSAGIRQGLCDREPVEEQPDHDRL